MSQDLVDNVKHVATRVAAAYPALASSMQSVVNSVALLERERQRLAARVLELEGEVVVPPDPPVVPGEPVDHGELGMAPDLDGLAVARVLPAWKPIFLPRDQDLDWVVTPGRAESQRGLGIVHGDSDDDGSVIGHAYRLSRAAGHGPRVSFGVEGYVGGCALGGFYGPDGGRDVTFRQGAGWSALDIVIVGLTPDAEVQLSWGGFQGGNQYGFTDSLLVSDCGIRLGMGVHGLTANSRAGSVVFHRCWLLQNPKMTGQYNAGLHTANLDSLVLIGLKRRGRKSSSDTVGIPLYQRHVLYHKNHRDALWVAGCDLGGGNQTGVQVRPGKGEPPAQFVSQGAVALVGNHATRYGYDHDGASGGALLSVWSSPHAPVVMARNVIDHPRYGGIVVQAQGGGLDWVNDDGLPFGDVFLSENEIRGRGDRPTVMVSAARNFVMDHRVGDDVLVDNDWGHKTHGLKTKRVRLVGAAREQVVRTWDPAKSQHVPVLVDTALSWEDVL